MNKHLKNFSVLVCLCESVYSYMHSYSSVYTINIIVCNVMHITTIWSSFLFELFYKLILTSELQWGHIDCESGYQLNVQFIFYDPQHKVNTMHRLGMSITFRLNDFPTAISPGSSHHFTSHEPLFLHHQL